MTGIVRVITFLSFVALPAYLLGDQYNFAVGFAYFSAVSALLSLHYEALETKAELALLSARITEWRSDWQAEKVKGDYAGVYRKGEPETY